MHMTNTCINSMSATSGMSKNLLGMQMCIYFNKQKYQNCNLQVNMTQWK
jgi:hypothetical protein